MKTIGIIGAMDVEIAELKNRMEIIQSKTIAGAEFNVGRIQGGSVVVAMAGIGKVNAAVCAQTMIDFYGVDYLVNIGVAGSLARDLNIGDVVVSDDLVQHDFDANYIGAMAGVIPGMKESFFRADAELVRMAKEAAESVLSGTGSKVYTGRIASGDQFISSHEAKHRILKEFSALCCEMEGAAIAHAAYLNDVPFVVIRSISDKADEEASVSFEKFMESTAKISSGIVERMVKMI